MVRTEQRCCFEIDTHQVALGLSGHLTGWYQERQRFLDLLEISGRYPACVQMLQHMNIGILQRGDTAGRRK